MIIGISGKIGSGKDTIGKIIQYLTSPAYTVNYTYSEFIQNSRLSIIHKLAQNWQIKKFADALKDIVCILTGCTREQLEDIDFKNSQLSNEWSTFTIQIEGIQIDTSILETRWNNLLSFNHALEFHKWYCQNYNVKDEHDFIISAHKMTYRDLLQQLGTNLLRNQLHENVWINALMSKYKHTPKDFTQNPNDYIYPNWIITDVRFPNEAQAIKDRNGIIIRVARGYDSKMLVLGKVINSEHPSETALDDYNFNYTIDNNGSIEELISKVRVILYEQGILKITDNSTPKL